MLHAVIMAGGSGTRFWPASREAKPKQLLNLVGDQSMIQATVSRLEGFVEPENLLVVTNQRLVKPIVEQLPSVPSASILGEPCKRDTAPCIGLAAAMISNRDPDATMVVMPADHVIQPDDKFREALQFAADLVEANEQRIVTFGISPTYPAEIYGYIERDPSRQVDLPGPPAYQVNRFREKPDAATAQTFIDSGNFYWNSGIFVWKAKTVWNALQQFEPEMYAHLDQIANTVGTDEFAGTLEREFTAITGTSIDYAVMERFQGEIVVVEAPFEWDDVGNWPAMARLLPADEQGNTVLGKHLGIDTKATIVRSEDNHLVVTLGVDNLIVVHTPDATLVADRAHEAQVKKVVDELKSKSWTELL